MGSPVDNNTTFGFSKLGPSMTINIFSQCLVRCGPGFAGSAVLADSWLGFFPCFFLLLFLSRQLNFDCARLSMSELVEGTCQNYHNK